MILGFGCSVPAVMASRALEDNKDRMKTMLVTPFMSCSARLPIYILFSQMFFGKHAMIAAYSMYVIGLVVAVFVAFILHIVDKKEANGMLIIECDTDQIAEGDELFIDVKNRVIKKINDKEFALPFTLSEKEIKILNEDGLLNYIEKYHSLDI